MGVTTKVGGNCGDSYNRLEDFCGRVNSQGSPTNYMMFVGQNSLREHAGAGDRYKPSTKAQLDQMKRELAACRKYGPVGLSCGFEYAPGVTTDETFVCPGGAGIFDLCAFSRRWTGQCGIH